MEVDSIVRVNLSEEQTQKLHEIKADREAKRRRTQEAPGRCYCSLPRKRSQPGIRRGTGGLDGRELTSGSGAPLSSRPV